MKSNKQNQLENKYLEGKTSLDEEQQFFRNQEKDGKFKAWAQYRQENQVVQPKDLIKSIEKEIDGQQPKSRSLLITLSSVAATLALLMIFFFKDSINNAMSYEEKAAKLEEVLNILPEKQPTNDYILYEDAMIVIYLETK